MAEGVQGEWMQVGQFREAAEAPFTARGPPSSSTAVPAPFSAGGRAEPCREAEKLSAARLRATAPMTAGPRVKPKSRSRLVVALAMPARWVGTVLTAVAVIDETVTEKPRPTRPSGRIREVKAVSVIGRVAAQ